jgi:hypothetical protein
MKASLMGAVDVNWDVEPFLFLQDRARRTAFTGSHRIRILADGAAKQRGESPADPPRVGAGR